jgi:hypothetical protein
MGVLGINVMAAPSVGLFVATLWYFRTLTYLERTKALELDKGAHVPDVMRASSKAWMLSWFLIRILAILLNLLRPNRRDDSEPR